MKSRTSFFNKTLYRKNLSRFAPVWAVYTIILLLYLSVIAGLGSDYRASRSGADMAQVMSIVNLIYAGVLVNFLFGDLFSSRHCNMLHAFPIRRETIFGTNLVTALVCSLVPNTLVAILALPFLGSGWMVSVYWLAEATLQFIFNMGTALVSIMLTGNRLGYLAVYVLVNFWSMLLLWFATTIFSPLLYGVAIPDQPFWVLCPACNFVETDTIRVEVLGDSAPDGAIYMDTLEHFTILPREGWGYVFLCAAIGIALTYLALVLYRKRKLESAGDFIAFKAVEPGFLVLFTLGVGAFFQLFSQMFGYGSQYIFLAVGIVIGFFACLMLLQKTTRVFTLRAFWNFGIFAVSLTLILLVVWLDPVGITRIIPEQDEIVSVKVGQGYKSSSYLWNTIELTEEADIEAIREVHRNVLEDRYYDSEGDGIHFLSFGMEYTLESGKTLTRYYQVPMETPAADILRPILSCVECVTQMSREEFLALEDRIYQIYVNAKDYALTEDEYKDLDMGGLLEAIVADCDAGNMVQYEQYHYYNVEHWDGDPFLEINYTGADGVSRSKGFTVFDSCVNTTTWLIENHLW